ncbi:MAG: hypothetical protein V8S95_01450 [Odoribacter sp.]
MDQNKDGVINQDDRVILGDATPDFYGGFYTSFRYKNFTLNAGLPILMVMIFTMLSAGRGKV